VISDKEVFKEAHRVGASDRVIEKDYVLSWLLVVIAESDLATALAFKGGTALKKIYYPEYRFSEDLDFTLLADLSDDELVARVEALFLSLARRPKLTCALLRPLESRPESTTLYVNFIGPLGASLDSRFAKVDFTRGELLLDPPQELPLRAPYRDYPSHVYMPTYTREEILTEKLCALIGRTEPRDLYDVYWLFESRDVDLTFVPHNLARKCEHKKQDSTRLYGMLADKQTTFARLWTSRLKQQVTELPDLEMVLRVVRKHVRELGPP
jgi:predicted nucleotidyltransferase component of viral defense system